VLALLDQKINEFVDFSGCYKGSKDTASRPFKIPTGIDLNS
jgi:hypothetical protein